MLRAANASRSPAVPQLRSEAGGMGGGRDHEVEHRRTVWFEQLLHAAAGLQHNSPQSA
jgi:hypothetical protein